MYVINNKCMSFIHIMRVLIFVTYAIVYLFSKIKVCKGRMRIKYIPLIKIIFKEPILLILFFLKKSRKEEPILLTIIH